MTANTERGFTEEKYLLFHLYRQYLCNIFVINAISDRRPRSDVDKILGMQDWK